MPNPMAMFQRAIDMIGDLARRVRILEVRNPLENAAVDRGGLYIKSNEGLVVTGSAKVEGWLIVTGTSRVTGRLEGSGTLDWTGPSFLRGATTIEGDLKVTKTLDVTATTKLQGVVTLLKDLIIQSPGKITAGTIEIEPSENGGVIKIGSARIWVKGGQFELSAGGFQIWTETGAICIGSRLGTFARLTGTEVQWVGLRTVLNVSVAPRTLMLDASNNMVMTRNT